MIFRIDRFFLDEKDLFTFFLGIFLAVSYFFQIPLVPFNFGSLVVLFLFLVLTRSMVSQLRYTAYMIIAFLGLLFSLVLSPYGVAIYFIIAMLIYVKSGAV